MVNLTMGSISSFLPERAKAPLKGVRDLLVDASYYGTSRLCSVCGNRCRKFREYGRPAREDARCHSCGALERHRFVWLYFNKHTNLFDGTAKIMLHIAPEKCFENRLHHRLGEQYVTADLLDPQVMVKMDITNIQYPDESFDVIYCSHVLEHVLDDRQAIKEFFRVLKPSGWAMLLVPVTVEKTFEDPSIVDPDERLRVFGQEDHVRNYGRDFGDRLREAGFKVTTVGVSSVLEENDAILMGLTCATGDIYFCTK